MAKQHCPCSGRSCCQSEALQVSWQSTILNDLVEAGAKSEALKDSWAGSEVDFVAYVSRRAMSRMAGHQGSLRGAASERLATPPTWRVEP